MGCSAERSTFSNDTYHPWSYDFENGTTLYCNGSYPMNWLCNSTTTADTDIAGPGVITSFILVAWITMFVAGVLAFYQLLEFLCRATEWHWRSSATTISVNRRSTNHWRRITQLRRLLNSERTALLRAAASNLLGPLCDLQIVTGFAIIVAGLTQMPDISFYHESLALSYWSLSLNSFWAARIEYMNENTTKYTRRATQRKIGVLISVVLGLVFQCIVYRRESQDWFFLRPDRCYIYHDNSSNLIWIVGNFIYAISLSLIIMPASRPWVHQYHRFLRHMQASLIEGWKKSATALQTCRYSQPVSGYQLSFMRFFLRVMFRMVSFALFSLCLLAYWLFLQFIAIWSYGEGFYPFQVLVYVGFAAWITFDILDLKLSNRPLILGQESSWGFGQILPMVLLVMIGYNGIDALRGENVRLVFDKF